MEQLTKFNIAYVFTRPNSGYQISTDQNRSATIESCIKWVLNSHKDEKDMSVISIMLVNQTNGLTTFHNCDKYRF